MSDTENYIRRNLIISEGLARTIPDSIEEQEIHLNRIAQVLDDKELADKILGRELTVDEKRKLLWNKIGRKKLVLAKSVIKYGLALMSLALLVYAASFVLTLFTPHKKWSAKYYGNIELLGDALEETELDFIKYDWSNKPPSSKLNGDNFSARFETCLEVRESKDYVFFIGSDDGSRFYINDSEVINHWKIQGFERTNVERRLEPGLYLIRLEYFQKGGAAALEFDIATKDKSQTTLKFSNLCKK